MSHDLITFVAWPHDAAYLIKWKQRWAFCIFNPILCKTVFIFGSSYYFSIQFKFFFCIVHLTKIMHFSYFVCDACLFCSVHRFHTLHCSSNSSVIVVCYSSAWIIKWRLSSAEQGHTSLSAVAQPGFWGCNAVAMATWQIAILVARLLADGEGDARRRRQAVSKEGWLF